MWIKSYMILKVGLSKKVKINKIVACYYIINSTKTTFSLTQYNLPREPPTSFYAISIGNLLYGKKQISTAKQLKLGIRIRIQIRIGGGI